MEPMPAQNHARNRVLKETAFSGDSQRIQLIEKRINDCFCARLKQNSDYRSEEISQVGQYSTRLFPRNFELEEDASDTLRFLAKLALTDLHPASDIQSHRRFLGPIIVWLKKLSWPFVRIHLKDTFAALREYHIRLLVLVAQQHAQLAMLRADGGLERRKNANKP
jgi:hypothetical protein